MFIQHNCAACGSTNLVKNGSTYYGKGRLLCQRCGRQFVEVRHYEPLSNESKRRIERMLAERISLEPGCRCGQLPGDGNQAPPTLCLHGRIIRRESA